MRCKSQDNFPGHWVAEFGDAACRLEFTVVSAYLFALLAPMALVGSKTQLVLLGTGTPRPDPDRSGSAAAIIVNGVSYLVDCGPGIVRRASAARLKVGDALAPSNLKTVFITHLHSDHTLGYPDLIFTPWVVGRKTPLEAYGPTGLQEMTSNILAAYKEDIDVRTHGLEHGNTTGFHVNVHEVKPGLIYKDSNISVTAFSVKHGSWKEAFGFRFETADRVIVFSGDTAPCEALEHAAQSADILVHEVYETHEAAPENRAGGEDWPAYLKAYHTSADELGAIAARCNPKLLVLTHVLKRQATDRQLLDEVRQAGFKGKVVIGKDLQVY